MTPNATTGAVKVSLTLKADIYELLEEMCRVEERHSISRQVSWLIKQYAPKKPSAPNVRRNGNIIYPAWK
jgi:hypothetical protein